MRRFRRPFSRSRRGVSNIIAAILLIAVTIIAGVTLWTLSFEFPPDQVAISYVAQGDLKVPAWGDPTDCASKVGSVWTNCTLINATQIIFTSHTPPNINLNQVGFTFICNGTAFVDGSLAAMTWFPGGPGVPSPNAPKLGVCGTFNPNNLSGHIGLFQTLYNRLGFFTPVHNVSYLEDGDTFTLYVHTPHSFIDSDTDDFHGAPFWCFQVPGLCTIYITFLGGPPQVLATIPLMAISGAGANG